MAKYITTLKSMNPHLDGNTTFVILGGAVQYTMKSYGSRLLFPYKDGMTLLGNALYCIEHNFKHVEVVVTTGFMSHKVVPYIPKNVRIVENQLFETTNQAEEIRLAINNCTTKNIVFIGGDVGFSPECLKDLRPDKSSVLVTNQLPSREIGVIINQGKANSMSFTDDDLKFAHIFLVSGKELELLTHIVSMPKNRMLFGYELINQVLMKNGHFDCIVTNAELIRIDKSKSFQEI